MNTAEFAAGLDRHNGVIRALCYLDDRFEREMAQADLNDLDTWKRLENERDQLEDALVSALGARESFIAQHRPALCKWCDL